MGTFRVSIAIENPLRRGELRTLDGALVDTGAELTCVPRPVLESLGIRREKTLRLRMADGRVARRDIGYAIVHAAGSRRTTKSSSARTATSFCWAPGRSKA